MAPLLIADPRVRHWERSPEWHKFYENAEAGKKLGIEGVVTDVWQGLVHANGTGNRADWSVSDLTFRILKDAKQKIGVVLSTHSAGENVADDTFIDIAPAIKAKIGGRLRIRQITITYSEIGNPRAKIHASQEIDRIRTEAIKNGNFEFLAKHYSQDVYAASQGEVGWIQRGTWNIHKEEALNRLRPGEISLPIEQPGEFSILQLVEVDSAHPDLAYVSETGARNQSLVSIWGLSHVLKDYKAYWTDFRDHYSKHPEIDPTKHFSELIISAGSAGEWRLPSYDQHDRKNGFTADADWPGRGLLQISSLLAQDSLRQAMRKKYGSLSRLNSAWGLSGSSAFSSWAKFSALTDKAEVDAFIKRHGQYSQMGQDIFQWMHESLLEYGYQLLKGAIEVFHAPGSHFSKVPIGIKIAGVHWRFLHRFPQLAAGLISTKGAKSGDAHHLGMGQPDDWKEANGNGYAGFFRVFERLKKEFPKSEIFPIFTCAEMDDCHSDCIDTTGHHHGGCHCHAPGASHPPQASGAKTLARGFVKLGERFGFPVHLENALASGLYDPKGRNNIVSLLKLPGARGVTFLRLSDVVAPGNNGAMEAAIKDIHSLTFRSCPEDLLAMGISAGSAVADRIP